MAPSLSQKKFKIMVIYFFFYKICNKVICSSPLQAPVPILSSPLLSSPLLSSPFLSFCLSFFSQRTGMLRGGKFGLCFRRD